MKAIVFLGIQGSGKGTQAAKLSEYLGYSHINIGDLLRYQISQKTPMGLKVSDIIKRGELVSDEIIYNLIQISLRSESQNATSPDPTDDVIHLPENTFSQAMHQRYNPLNSELSSTGIIFDGFPRTEAQAKYLLDRFSIIRVYYLDMSIEEAISRISARRVCPKCGHNYNLITNKPVHDCLCDNCGIELISRQDDKPESMNKRIAEFFDQTFVLKEFFDRLGLLKVLPANQTIDQIFEGIKSDLMQLQSSDK